MKRLVCILLIVLNVIAITACGSPSEPATEESTSETTLSIDEEVSRQVAAALESIKAETTTAVETLKTYDWEKDYIKPDYAIYSTPASENGLADTLVYVNCIVEEVYPETFNSICYKVNNNGDKWVLVSIDITKELPIKKGDTITAYGSYRGVAGGLDDLPIVYVSKIKSAGETWESEFNGITPISKWITETCEGVTFKVDPLWGKKENDSGGYWYYPAYGLVQSLTEEVGETKGEDVSELFSSFVEGLLETDGAEVVGQSTIKIGKFNALKINWYLNSDKERYHGDTIAILLNKKIVTISVFLPVSKYESYEYITECVLNFIDLVPEETTYPKTMTLEESKDFIKEKIDSSDLAYESITTRPESNAVVISIIAPEGTVKDGLLLFYSINDKYRESWNMLIEKFQSLAATFKKELEKNKSDCDVIFIMLNDANHENALFLVSGELGLVYDAMQDQ